MIESEFRAEMTALVAALIPTIRDDYRAGGDCECCCDPCECAPSMLLTVGADANGWSYQTGDNSYSGGAYGYSTWGVAYLYRDSDPAAVADDIVNELVDHHSDAVDSGTAPLFPLADGELGA